MDHPHLRTRRLGIGTAVLAIVVVLAACSGNSSQSIGSTTTSTSSAPASADDSSPGLQPPPGWKLPDTRNAVLLAAPSNAKPAPIPVVGGHSTITGTVTGPDGPVAGATVRIERFVGTTSGSVQVGTDGAGHFALGGALGGRYKVRAWLQPDLATFVAPTGFVADGDSLDLSPTLERHNAITLQLASRDAVLSLSAPGGVRALLTRETVDSNGIVQAGGSAGESITLVSSDGAIAVTSANPALTDASGAASWVIQCTAAGAHDVSATVGDQSATLTLPACTDAPPSTTSTTAPATTTTRPGRTTTTTRPIGPGH